ncbi:hypothetical protein RRG08_019299 [Elysia crispata]|uniref:Uncharacterized protein n=1 Tax=Elysia crispata TaxID=231223 RepID=A0AAE1D1R3_9GAST|nr:hypothetical protein RRG08_019299 [Elysia crispata]
MECLFNHRDKLEGFKQANCRLSNGHNTLSASLELEKGVGVGSEVVTNSSQDGDKRVDEFGSHHVRIGLLNRTSSIIVEIHVQHDAIFC